MAWGGQRQRHSVFRIESGIVSTLFHIERRIREDAAWLFLGRDVANQEKTSWIQTPLIEVRPLQNFSNKNRLANRFGRAKELEQIFRDLIAGCLAFEFVRRPATGT